MASDDTSASEIALGVPVYEATIVQEPVPPRLVNEDIAGVTPPTGDAVYPECHTVDERGRDEPAHDHLRLARPDLLFNAQASMAPAATAHDSQPADTPEDAPRAHPRRRHARGAPTIGGVLVRQLGAADLAACVAIEELCYPPPVVEGLASFERELRHFPAGCWVAVDTGGAAPTTSTDRVIGYAICMPTCMRHCPLESSYTTELPMPSDADADRTLYVHDLAVAPEARGAGIGALLLQQVLMCAITARVPSVTLTEVCGARGFWEHHGFACLTELSEAACERLRTYPEKCGEVHMMQRAVSL